MGQDGPRNSSSKMGQDGPRNSSSKMGQDGPRNSSSKMGQDGPRNSSSKMGQDRPKMIRPGRAGLYGQLLVTNLYSKVQIHVECNGTLWHLCK